MTTQSLRGMANHGPMHWRGDRTGGNDPGGYPLDETQAFLKFNVAFDGLLGRGGSIPGSDMAAFAAFILDVTYPPNPIRALDDSLTPDQLAGHDFFFTSFPSDVFQSCNGCHRIDPFAGFFGSDGFSSFEFEPQQFKIPHLRNLYQKVGMFGMLWVPFFNQGDNGHKGDQVRGFGFLHDGSTDTVFRFHHSTVFNQTLPGGFPIPNPGGFPAGPAGDTLRRQVEAFLLASDSNLKPIVGQQVTLTAANAASSEQHIVGKKILIKDPSTANPAKRKVLLKSTDVSIVSPTPGGAGDPRCGAQPPSTLTAKLTIITAAGQSHVTSLRCGHWRLLGSPSHPHGYKYTDPDLVDGAVRTVLWKDGKLKAVLSGAGIGIDLQEGVAQHVVTAELNSGEQRVCMSCTGSAFDGSDGAKFLGQAPTCFAPTCITSSAGERIDLLIARAAAPPTPDCDPVVKGTVAGEARGWRYRPASDDFQSDRAAEGALSDAQLRALVTVAGQELTYTCVPPGSGLRIGIDRDEDGFFDRDEIDAGSDPADPGSTP